MSLTQIVKDGQAGFQNLPFISDKLPKPYPTDIAERISNKIVPSDKSWKKSLGYAFRVVRAKNEAVFPAEGWGEFTLQINPQDLSQDEIFAIEVTPTFSGVLVEHQGVTLKDINISGTTGLSPGRRGGGAFPFNGRPVFAAGRSGYEEFNELRTYFRTYVEQKRNDKEKDSGELRLVWRNFRDHEDLYVEPQKFTMKRSSSKPFLYDYIINLKGIGKADIPKDAGGWLSVIQDIDGVIEDVQDTLDSVTKVIEGAVDFLLRVERDITNTILNPIRSLNATLNAIKKGQLALTGAKQRLSKLNIRNLRNNLLRVYDNSQDFLGKDTKAYNKAKGRIATLKSVLADHTRYKEEKASHSLLSVAKALDKLMQLNELFYLQQSEAKNFVKKLYKNSLTAKQQSANLEQKKALEKTMALAKERSDISAFQAATEELEALARSEAEKVGKAAKELTLLDSTTSRFVTIEGQDNIQILASRYLGSPDRFKDIVLFNNLKAPYIDPTPLEDNPVRVDGVLRPGDQIRIPQSGSGKDVKSAANQEYPITKNLEEAEKNFGVDLALTDDYDLAVSNTGDIKLIAGNLNVVQAMVVKLLLSTGSLKRHPEIGAGLQIGSKSVQSTFIVERVRNALLADPRIESVIYAGLRIDGGSYFVDLILKLKNIDQPINVPIQA